MMMLREHEFSDRSLYHDVLIATVSCHGLRPPNHCMLYYRTTTGLASTSVFGCLWLSLVVGRIGYLSTRFLGESLVYILRENRGRTEELTGYWVIHSGICLFIRIRLWALIDLTFELNK
ncbi:hypothetical protein Naga_100628g2 [Nannochloropsis gaditana]|uniref:Uncharacterized protein n=1 Tax=Nannochloropsis gaditana TaxID=72520 RepID=W7TMS1_9STRA|nr:hypothetical protein Naga_100628g2 [Nannochloropsis gaditana]